MNDLRQVRETGDYGEKARESCAEFSKVARESGDQRLILAAQALGSLVLTGLEIADAIDGLTDALAEREKRQPSRRGEGNALTGRVPGVQPKRRFPPDELVKVERYEDETGRKSQQAKGKAARGRRTIRTKRSAPKRAGGR